MRTDVAPLSALLVAIWSAPALAYIDPGTGSMAYQILLTGFLAVSYAIRRFVKAGTSGQVFRRLMNRLGSRT